MAPVDTLDVRQYATQYELLRSQFTGAASGTDAGCAGMQPRGTGLALLLREGLPAWIRALRQVLRASLAPSGAGVVGSPAKDATPIGSYAVAVGTPEVTVPSASLLPSAQRRDVTAILANLVLSTCRLVGSAQGQEYRSCR